MLQPCASGEFVSPHRKFQWHSLRGHFISPVLRPTEHASGVDTARKAGGTIFRGAPLVATAARVIGAINIDDTPQSVASQTAQ